MVTVTIYVLVAQRMRVFVRIPDGANKSTNSVVGGAAFSRNLSL